MFHCWGCLSQAMLELKKVKLISLALLKKVIKQTYPLINERLLSLHLEVRPVSMKVKRQQFLKRKRVTTSLPKISRNPQKSHRKLFNRPSVAAQYPKIFRLNQSTPTAELKPCSRILKTQNREYKRNQFLKEFYVSENTKFIIIATEADIMRSVF